MLIWAVGQSQNYCFKEFSPSGKHMCHNVPKSKQKRVGVIFVLPCFCVTVFLCVVSERSFTVLLLLGVQSAERLT